MLAQSIQPTGVERFFGEDDIIVSKTDLKGRITYCNDVCRDVAGYKNNELVGQPHSILRHPDMPRSVFKLLWDTIVAKREIFAYVVNITKTGDHYWVFAHVTPSINANGEIIGYHSNRRVPNRDALEKSVIPLYRQLCEIEQKPSNRKQGLEAGFHALTNLLKEKNVTYDEFVFAL
ncbi:MAG: PAS domain-containing protein [bacterium]|nr:PAS domain-containing protein [bacterium]